jgi:hypothetical protein
LDIAHHVELLRRGGRADAHVARTIYR